MLGQRRPPASRGEIAVRVLRFLVTGHRLQIVIETLQTRAVRKEHQRQPPPAQASGVDETRQRIAVEVDPTVRHLISGEEVPCRVQPRSAASSNDCDWHRHRLETLRARHEPSLYPARLAVPSTL